MKAITTKFFGPTNSHGARIKASTEDQSVTISYDYSLSPEKLHAKAAVALCKKMGWTGTLISGGVKGGYVFVFANSDKFKI